MSYNKKFRGVSKTNQTLLFDAIRSSEKFQLCNASRATAVIALGFGNQIKHGPAYIGMRTTPIQPDRHTLLE